MPTKAKMFFSEKDLITLPLSLPCSSVTRGPLSAAAATPARTVSAARTKIIPCPFIALDRMASMCLDAACTRFFTPTPNCYYVAWPPASTWSSPGCAADGHSHAPLLSNRVGCVPKQQIKQSDKRVSVDLFHSNFLSWFYHTQIDVMLVLQCK